MAFSAGDSSIYILTLEVEHHETDQSFENQTPLHSRNCSDSAWFGGTIQVTYPWDDPVALICNEEGKLLGFGIDNFNRTLLTDDGTPIDVIAGTFLITGLTEDDFGSLSPELLAKYEKMLHCPDRFWRTIDEHGRTHLKIDYEPENTVK